MGKGRKRRKDLDYFTLKVDYYADPKICELQERTWHIAAKVYIDTICMIYQNGYYTTLNGELIEKLATYSKLELQQTKYILDTCAELSLFDQSFYAKGIITSKNIQELYVKTNALRRQKCHIEEYKLVEVYDTANGTRISVYESENDPPILVQEIESVDNQQIAILVQEIDGQNPILVRELETILVQKKETKEKKEKKETSPHTPLKKEKKKIKKRK